MEIFVLKIIIKIMELNNDVTYQIKKFTLTNSEVYHSHKIWGTGVN